MEHIRIYAAESRPDCSIAVRWTRARAAGADGLPSAGPPIEAPLASVATRGYVPVMGGICVLVLAPAFGRDLSFITAVDPSIRVVDGSTPAAQAGKAAPVDEAEVLLIGYPVPRDPLRRAPRARWAHHTQAGVSNLHHTDLWTSSVTLTTGRGFVAPTAIAEYVLAAAAYFARDLHEAMRQKAAGDFTRAGYDPIVLRRATMGIVGMGGIGSEVARLARAVGMRVVATRRSTATVEQNVGYADVLLPPGDLSTLAAQSDFVAVCSQLTDETRGMIDARFLKAMKPTAMLVNVARGEVVDEEALVHAIRERRIRGAVLDVYEHEQEGKPPRRELLDLSQVILTPHISSGGDPAVVEQAKLLFTDNLDRFINSRPLLNVVDRKRGY